MINQSDLMGAAELRQLLGVTDRTLTRYRLKHWEEGIHYVAPVQRVLYVRPMITDWILHHKNNPGAHQDAKEQWLTQTQGRKARRNAS
jgi:Putative excisionase (DUF1233)